MIYVYHTIRWVTNDKNDFAPHSRNNEVSMRLFQRQIRPECQFANPSSRQRPEIPQNPLPSEHAHRQL